MIKYLWYSMKVLWYAMMYEAWINNRIRENYYFNKCMLMRTKQHDALSKIMFSE